MALRGDKIVLYAEHHSSGTVQEIIAGSTSVNFSSSSAFLESTDQADGLNTNGIGGKNNRTITGDYFATSTLDNFKNLFARQEDGHTISWTIKNNGADVYTGDAVITQLDFNAGTADQLVTGSYTLQVVGAITTS